MKTNRPGFRKPVKVVVTVILVVGSLDLVSATASDGPFSPWSPSPNAGVAQGQRSAGDFTARRPGNLPDYGGRTHSYTGVGKNTQSP